MTVVERLKNRADFLRVQEGGRSIKTAAFVFVFMPSELPSVRVGFTASRKLGHSPDRNRARRRLRAAVDRLMRLNPRFSTPQGVDIVLIARHKVLTCPFNQLEADLRTALSEAACQV